MSGPLLDENFEPIEDAGEDETYCPTCGGDGVVLWQDGYWSPCGECEMGEIVRGY